LRPASSISACGCLENLVSKMTYYVSSWSWNSVLTRTCKKLLQQKCQQFPKIVPLWCGRTLINRRKVVWLKMLFKVFTRWTEVFQHGYTVYISLTISKFKKHSSFQSWSPSQSEIKRIHGKWKKIHEFFLNCRFHKNSQTNTVMLIYIHPKLLLY